MGFTKIIFFQLFFMVVIIAACSGYISPTQPKSLNTDNNEFLIYSIVIDSLLLVPGREWMVFLDSTETWFFQPQDSLQFPTLQQATIDNYIFCNQVRYPFKIAIDGPLNLDFISWKSWELLGGWEGFYQTYPNSPGLVGFSRIGFNETGDQALIYISLNIHYLAGFGYMIILSKRERWEIDQMEMVWIS